MNDNLAIVTGGTKGIGRSVSLQLAERGMTVVATYYSDEDAAATTRADLDSFEQPTDVVQFDVSDHAAVEQNIERITDKYGAPNVLVNNAGTVSNNLSVKMTPSEWNTVLQTNLSGTFFCSKAVLEHMFLGDGGSIVNVSSVGALRGWAGQANYASSKSGVIGLTRSLAREYGDKDIRVNAVCPGYTDTELLDELNADEILEEEDIPQNRVATPDEVANTITFLASDQASYVNGAVLRVDGGLLA